MNVPDSPNLGWKPCVDGELQQLVGQLRRRRLRKKLRPIAAGTAALLLLVVGVLISGPGVEKPAAAASLTCRQAEEILPQYVARELDPEKDAELVEHLERCAHCRAMAEQLRQQDAKPEQPQTRRSAPRKNNTDRQVAVADLRF